MSGVVNPPMGTALIIDDWAIARWGMAAALERSGFTDVHASATATHALSLLRTQGLRPSIAVVGAVVDQTIAAVTRTLTHDYACGVVALLPSRAVRHVVQILQCGARAVVERDARSVDVMAAIAAAVEGRRHISGGLLDDIAGARSAPRALVDLTPRELEILEGLVAGLTNRAIAERLSISEETVKSHVSRLFQKLGVHRRTQAVGIGLQLGLV